MNESVSPTAPHVGCVISFDLWMTLIRNDPSFKLRRADHIRRYLAPNFALDVFDKVMRAVDKEADKIAESRGSDVNYPERITMLALAVEAPAPSDTLIDVMYAIQGVLFNETPPYLLEPDTAMLFDRLKENGYKLAALSNTGFMHGDQMRSVLDKIGIGQKFDYSVFSNEVGFAKPDKRIFEALLSATGVTPDKVTHIGDNFNADVNGAHAMGMHARHINEDNSLRTIVEGLL